MTSKRAVEEFLAEKSLAIVGVSRNGKGFGNAAMRELQANGYRVFPVHPTPEAVRDVPCYPSLSALPAPVGGLLIVVPPERTDTVVRDAAAAGIHRVWMQLGAASKDALAFCKENGIEAIHDECILLYLEKGPAIHRWHRRFRQLFGRMPK